MSGVDRPEVTSPPLPNLTPVELPTPGWLIAEITRAATELKWAITKHRRAWERMEFLSKHYEGKGNGYFKDNERPWKLATGDVQWWRGEMSCQSNTLTSLVTLATAMGVKVPGYVETTNPGDPQPEYIRGS